MFGKVKGYFLVLGKGRRWSVGKKGKNFVKGKNANLVFPKGSPLWKIQNTWLKDRRNCCLSQNTAKKERISVVPNANILLARGFTTSRQDIFVLFVQKVSFVTPKTAKNVLKGLSRAMKRQGFGASAKIVKHQEKFSKFRVKSSGLSAKSADILSRRC